MTRTLHLMLLRSFFPVLLIAVLFFVSILQLVDLFGSITRYIDLEVPFTQVLRVQLLYVPRSVHFALPMSLLFAVSFSLGMFYSNNELVAVLGAGVSLRTFVAPLALFAIAASFGSFLFEEHVAIDAQTAKARMEQELLGISRSESSSNITRLGSGGRMLYSADYYNAATRTLSGVTVVVRDESGALQRIVSARSARWNGENWEIQTARVFDRAGDSMTERYVVSESIAELSLGPAAFARSGRDLDEMRLEEAWFWIESQRAAGLPFRRDLTRFHERYSFSLTPFVVVLISMAVGGRFRRNILLMSLLVSLCVAVGYYVTQMVAGLLAVSGYVSPILGAWSGVLLFSLIGVVMLNLSRT